ncbi:MAG: hypothetical protein ACRD7E_31740 [Bryobacteraceae bacterium]
MTPAQSRIARHLRPLGILWLALSAFRFVPGLILLVMVDSGMFWRDGAPPFLAPLMEGVAAVLLTLALAGVVAGWGLLSKQPWARLVAIVLGAVNLVDIPFGTALGIYTFWVLLPAESEQQYQRITSAQPA